MDHETEMKYAMRPAIVRQYRFLFLLLAGLALLTASPLRANHLTVVIGACGFPISGGIGHGETHTFTLTEDCRLEEGTVGFSANITVHGNGYRIYGPNETIAIVVDGTTTLAWVSLNDVTIIGGGSHASHFPTFWVDGPQARLSMNNVTIRDAVEPIGVMAASVVELRDVRFVNNVSSAGTLFSAVGVKDLGSSATIINGIFRNNDGSEGVVLALDGGSITFEGCLTFEGNTLQGINVDHPGYVAFGNSSTITDNSTGPCPVASVDDTCTRLGAIGLICRLLDSQPAIDIYGISAESQGYILLHVTQSMVDAAQPAGLVANTDDGRVAVIVWEDRNVTIQMGPTDEGKIHHVTLAGDLNGPVIGTIDTIGGPPAAGLTPAKPAAGPTPPTNCQAPSVEQQSACANGSIVHVIRSGDTVYSIALAYGVDLQEIIERNQLTDGGRLIFPGQELIIRDAPTPDAAEDDE